MPKDEPQIYRPMLARAERYIQSEEAPGSGYGPKEYPRSLSETQDIILPQLNNVKASMLEIDEAHRIEEIVFSMDLMPDFLAKSYFPSEVIIKSNLTLIGSKRISVPVSDHRKMKRANKNLQEEETRKLFVSARSGSIDLLKKFLNNPPTQKIEQDFRKIDAVGIQHPHDKIINIPANFNGMAEVVLHGFPDHFKEEEIKKFITLCDEQGLVCRKEHIRSYKNGPIFCPVTGGAEGLYEIAKYNPLRVLRQMPGLQPLTEIRNTNINMVPPVMTGQSRPPVTVGMFDGGVDTSHPAMNICTYEESLTSEQPQKEFVSHGTAVASALAYGPLSANSQVSPVPRVGIHSFRVFPIPARQFDADLNYVIDQIESIVPQSDLKFYNLSIGPNYPIDDDDIGRFTYALDQLALKHKVVFFIAVGNSGEAQHPYCRIQPASDMVNGVAVGALTHHLNSDGTWEKRRAAYSCTGPGRNGALRKPDLSAFGGCAEHPFLVFSNESPTILSGTNGTSFSCPSVTGVAGALYHSQTGILNALAIRVLVIHTAKQLNEPQTLVGNGEALNSVDEILACEKNKVTIVYQDEIKFGQYNRLPILIPDDLPERSRVNINWTIAYLPSINPNSPDEYTAEQLGVVFRPNDRKFNFSPPKDSDEKSQQLDIVEDGNEIVTLLSNGYKQAKLPATKNTKPKFLTEQDLRNEGKWQDTVILGQGNTMSQNLSNPSLTLHFENRYGINRVEKQDSLSFACIITIEAKKTFDLYQKIRQKYRELLPLRVRDRIRI